ncbi:MAG: single-stranded DNA-binding protein [Oscillospiraceae bacterium]|jgi:single-stranded DNA-binding protein|nr:single-stranded DNA-binding protein [Oscillospiraceae bacterium]
MNSILLRGVISEEARYSHESHGVRYFSLTISTVRLSGTRDISKVLISESALHMFSPGVGERVEIEGALRSFNNKSGQGSRLVLSTLAKVIRPSQESSENRVSVQGVVCKTPIYRRTPLGREICDLMIAVPRAYGRADYLPVITWGICARMSAELDVGDSVSVEGRFQSRSYVKNVGEESVEKTAYEISAIHISKLPQSEETSKEAPLSAEADAADAFPPPPKEEEQTEDAVFAL